jgi:hypothetical protein
MLAGSGASKITMDACDASPCALRSPVQVDGKVSAGGASGTGTPGGQASRNVQARVGECSMLTRTAASGVLEEYLAGHAESLKNGSRTANGRACLARWDMELTEVEECRETLMQSAGLYREFDWPSDEEDPW